MTTKVGIPPLANGEVYLFGIVDASGDVEHTILLPGDNDEYNHENQIAWAKSIDGVLPNRIEQAVMFAKFRDRFQRGVYWSDSTCQWESSCAWCQIFDYGHQFLSHKGAALRAVAVRRVKGEAA